MGLDEPARRSARSRAACPARADRAALPHAPAPGLDPALLRIETFARANVGLLLLGMAFFSTILANVLFLVGVWGYSVLTAGLAVVPGAIATAIVADPARARSPTATATAP